MADFGLARSLRAGEVLNADVIAEGVGTPHYMAPEQIFAARQKDIGPEADVYSLGVMLFELLDGDRPFDGGAEAVRRKHRELDPPAIAAATVPQGLKDLARACLRKDPAARPSVKTVITELVPASKAERAAFEQAQNDGTLPTWRSFLQHYPNGWFQKAAEERLAKAREADAYKRAKDEGTVSALNTFLEEFSEGTLTDAAQALRRELKEEADFVEARSADTPGAWESYLNDWSDGEHAAHARRRLRETREAQERIESARHQQEKEAYQRALSEGTEAALVAFLEVWEGGDYAEQAWSELEKIEKEARAIALARAVCGVAHTANRSLFQITQAITNYKRQEQQMKRKRERALGHLTALLSRAGESAAALDRSRTYQYIKEGADLLQADTTQLEIHADALLPMAVRLDQIETAEALLKLGASPDARDEKGRLVLIEAVLGDQVNMAQVLLNAGAHPNQTDGLDNTPLHVAAFLDAFNTVRVLLDTGADPSLENHRSHTPIQIAAENNAPSVAYLLLRHETDAPADTPHPAVVTAIRADAVDAFKSMIEAVPFMSEYVHEAIRADASAIVAYLLKAKAVFHHAPEDGTLLHLAAKHDAGDTTRMLIGHGADVNSTDSDGRAPLHWAARHDSHRVASVLLGNGARTEIQDAKGLFPLFLAARRGNYALVTKLIEGGADPDQQTPDGAAALHTAVYNNRHKAIRALIEEGANVNIQNKNLATPLYTAVYKDHVVAARILLREGKANPNCKRRNKMTPLHDAVKDKESAMAQVLLEEGANPEIKNYKNAKTYAYKTYSGGGQVGTRS